MQPAACGAVQAQRQFIQSLRLLVQTRAAQASQKTSARAARKSAAAAAAPAVAAASGLPPPQDKTLAFAREQELKGQPGVAREIYQEFVNQFPTDPAAAEAHFRLGELAYRERRFPDAIVEYGAVARDFPDSSSAPDALLRTGESMLQAGMRDDARTVLAEVPKRYPATAAATRAKQRLGELGVKP